MTDWTDPETFVQALERAETKEKGNCFEDFEEGDVIEHDPGLTLTQFGNEGWMSQTLNHDPAYWRSDAAESRGFDEPPIHPDYLTAATLGITVEDLSEKGGYFLGRTDVRFPGTPVYDGTELHVESEVVSTATSSSRPEYGIVSWRTRGTDAETGEILCSYERTNMIPRRESVATDGGEGSDGSRSSSEGSSDGGGETATIEDDGPSLPETFVTPEGGYFEDFVAALEESEDRDAAVAYQHERGRTQDDVTVASLPLATLNTAKQHHNVDVMADSPSGDIVTYGDVTRSTALGHARSDEQTWREVGFDDEKFHTFVAAGDTVYAFTRVLEAENDASSDEAGTVRFEHVAFNQDDEPVYSGTRTAEIQKRTH
ncbi:2-methylfumaryl-CoA hydratase [Natronobacterium gregoryi]|uniref:Acyl dehydratase n=2 Tax=Natronobacterium gregoryi TaxID=44930 RepID=L0AN46_NATGS|nr:2-methylfumaryl-CoA hydratase [Natronobacterium gregoryi]AFZ74505.1 acyl dehydratase [Natronobacterium gregoryi SP2]ELY72421.1 MaoC domain-containing protein dehydratase [Natronobacterium gregoryi SP2]PLK21749.1 MaoC family dehydratase [Natronobacterium gregoryi SP2]SFI98196.1 L-erythro-3-methylmalyl-CoA dehydratase [Natronobacterium gregoryi]